MTRTQRKQMLSNHIDDMVRDIAYKAWYMYAGVINSKETGSYFSERFKSTRNA